MLDSVCTITAIYINDLCFLQFLSNLASEEGIDSKDGLLLTTVDNGSSMATSAAVVGDSPTSSRAIISQFYDLLTGCVEGNIRSFCARVPSTFSEVLSPTDADLLFQNACQGLFVLWLAYRYANIM